MDIQEMIDSRIGELRAQAVGHAGSYPAPDPLEKPAASMSGIHDGRLESGVGQRSLSPEISSLSQQGGGAGTGLMSIGEEIDIAMTDVANQALEISEKLAGDYARIEREMLESRLMVLRSIESVLDTVLSLRRKMRNIGSSLESVTADYRQSPAASRDLDPAGRAMIGDRASMRESGVAALFRRTL